MMSQHLLQSQHADGALALSLSLPRLFIPTCAVRLRAVGVERADGVDTSYECVRAVASGWRRLDGRYLMEATMI